MNAAELRQAESNRAFAPALEAEYLRFRLFHNRTLIRATTTAALLLSFTRGSDRLLGGAFTPLALTDLGVVVAISLMLVWLAWGPAFERSYLRYAHVIMPLRNIITAAHFGG
ncbi:MAG TPA: hypothetical protein VFY39_01885, partial [Gammaproteobacteria bacterium]|nr:hypothetical protein [Gammaproteobacteria bacterium]